MKDKLFIPPPVQEITLLADQPQAFKRILIMEDNPEVIKKLQRFLEARHFDVLFAKTAVSALREIIEQDFDVIICDMIKPSFSGQMFHVAVSRVKPHLCNRFIFTAGRVSSSETSVFIKEVNGVMLWKPFESHVLLETIQLVLTKQKARAKAPDVVAPETPRARPVSNPNLENLRLLQLSLASATKSICIVSSYFVCDDATVKLLCGAGERGMRVEIFVPANRNGQAREAKFQGVWGKLAEAGVKIWITETTPDVGRLIICDESWACFTRSNFNVTNLNVYHREFAVRYLRSTETLRRHSELWKAESKDCSVEVSRITQKEPLNFYSRCKSLLSGMVQTR